MYNAKAVANYYLDMADRNGATITPMKLQKLVYFAHGWNLAVFGTPLISDPIEAWKFGPVIPSLYREFKHEGAGVILSRATDIDLDKFELVKPNIPEEDRRERALLDKVWSVYSPMTAIELSNLTHVQDSPWHKVRTSPNGSDGNREIPNQLIREYFVNQAAQ